MPYTHAASTHLSRHVDILKLGIPCDSLSILAALALLCIIVATASLIVLLCMPPRVRTGRLSPHPKNEINGSIVNLRQHDLKTIESSVRFKGQSESISNQSLDVETHSVEAGDEESEYTLPGFESTSPVAVPRYSDCVVPFPSEDGSTALTSDGGESVSGLSIVTLKGVHTDRLSQRAEKVEYDSSLSDNSASIITQPLDVQLRRVEVDNKENKHTLPGYKYTSPAVVPGNSDHVVPSQGEVDSAPLPSDGRESVSESYIVTPQGVHRYSLLPRTVKVEYDSNIGDPLASASTQLNVVPCDSDHVVPDPSEEDSTALYSEIVESVHETFIVASQGVHTDRLPPGAEKALYDSSIKDHSASTSSQPADAQIRPVEVHDEENEYKLPGHVGTPRPVVPYDSDHVIPSPNEVNSTDVLLDVGESFHEPSIVTPQGVNTDRLSLRVEKLENDSSLIKNSASIFTQPLDGQTRPDEAHDKENEHTLPGHKDTPPNLVSGESDHVVPSPSNVDSTALSLDGGESSNGPSILALQRVHTDRLSSDSEKIEYYPSLNNPSASIISLPLDGQTRPDEAHDKENEHTLPGHKDTPPNVVSYDTDHVLPSRLEDDSTPLPSDGGKSMHEPFNGVPPQVHINRFLPRAEKVEYDPGLSDHSANISTQPLNANTHLVEADDKEKECTLPCHENTSPTVVPCGSYHVVPSASEEDSKALPSGGGESLYEIPNNAPPREHTDRLSLRAEKVEYDSRLSENSANISSTQPPDLQRRPVETDDKAKEYMLPGHEDTSSTVVPCGSDHEAPSPSEVDSTVLLPDGGESVNGPSIVAPQQKRDTVFEVGYENSPFDLRFTSN